MYVDAHLHLDMFTPDDLEGVINRAAAGGVVLLISAAMDLESSRQTAAIAGRYACVRGAAGIHPWLAREWTSALRSAFREVVQAPGMVAVGEIGLDYGPRNPDRAAQQAVLRGLIEVAGETDRRLVIHSRQAAEDTVRLLRECGAEQIGGQIHEFTPDDAFVDACLEMGFSINAGRSLLVERAETADLRRIIQRVPLDRLLIETDAAPAYDHGAPVEPAQVTRVAAAVGALKGLRAEEVGAATLGNAARLFRIPPEEGWP